MKKIILFLLDFYKVGLSPILENLFGKGCRFTPSCSEYTKDSIEKFGVIRGLALGVKRISKCHPLGSSGFDPVPERI